MQSHCWPEIELFSQWRHSTSYTDLSGLLSRSWSVSGYDTLKLLFYMRDCHDGGQGDREQFYQGIRWLSEHHPEQVVANLRVIPEFGYWKDLLNLWGMCKNELIRASILYLYCSQLRTDYAALERGTEMSLAAKWAPTEKGADDKRWGFVKLFCEQLGWSRRNYRLRISQMRNALAVTERLMSDRRWGELDFVDIPSKSRKALNHALQVHCGRRYARWCERTAEMNRVYLDSCQGIDLVASLLAGADARSFNSMWRDYVRPFGDGHFGDTLCMCNSSQGMDSIIGGGGSLDVALALTLLISSRAAPTFRNKILTYTSKPVVLDITGESPSEQITSLRLMASTFCINLRGLFETLRDGCEQLPSQVFIFTNVDFEMCQLPTIFDWPAVTDGLDLPIIYFWNINKRHRQVVYKLDHYHDTGLIEIDGFNNDLYNIVTKTGRVYPWAIMRNEIDGSEYSKIRLV